MNNFTLEFINNFKENLNAGLYNFNNTVNALIDKKELLSDPNLDNLNNELKSIGYSIKILKIKDKSVHCEITKIN